MARDENLPWVRGASFHSGDTVPSTEDLFGGKNIEGKEYVDEDVAPIGVTKVATGRKVVLKVVRNVSGVALKPGRTVRFSAASTAPFECRVEGYAIAASDRVAGVVDEYLPSAGVPNNDLFYIVVGGPTKLTQGATTGAAVTPGQRLVPVAYGATAGDDLGGRYAVQDLTGATSVLANQIQNAFAVAATTAAATVNGLVDAVVTLRY